MRKILSICLVLISLNSFAQKVVHCVTDELHLKAIQENPLIKVEEDKANQIAREFASKLSLAKKGTVIYIPVVFHIIHKNGFENITQAQVNDCLRVLNEDFRKMAGTKGGTSTDSRAVDAEIEFKLAQIDPFGKPTDGVNRIANATQTDDGTDATKTLSYWDSNKYFNIWVVNIINSSSAPQGSIILGYAQFPFSRSSRPSTDGIIVRADQVGVIGSGLASQGGRTVTHEAGHWCGLYHPFQGGCAGGLSSNCASQGDQICDTPPVAASTNGCPENQNSCTNDVPNLPDLVKNYMDYADGTCMDVFTAGQSVRMKSQMQAYRSNIYSTTNLSAAGLNADGSYKTLTAASTKAPFLIDFNSQNPFWEIENFMNIVNGWKVNYQLGSNDGTCMFINSFANGSTSTLNTRDAFHTSNIDITSLTSPELSFKIAYAKRLTGSNDKLNMFISDNYGRTEILARTFSANEMETAVPNNTSAFVPTSTQWKTLKLDLTPFKTYTNFRVRFEMQSLRGNNTYIDDIKIGELSTSTNELKNTLNLNIYPNPTNTNSVISFNSICNEELTINLFDISGKFIKNVSKTNYQIGENTIELSASDLSKGIYIIKFEQNNQTYTSKWIVN